jgi:hypothetical protein
MAHIDLSSPMWQLYEGVLNGTRTKQDFVDAISNNIANNRIKSHLHTYLHKTNELEREYNLENQDCSPRFEIQFGGNQQNSYHYYIKKCYGHYCMYISIPAGHKLHGNGYDSVPDATFSGADSTDPSRWLFGWDYAHANMLNINGIFYYSSMPEVILEMQIITYDFIEADVNKYSAFLAQSDQH